MKSRNRRRQGVGKEEKEGSGEGREWRRKGVGKEEKEEKEGVSIRHRYKPEVLSTGVE